MTTSPSAKDATPKAAEKTAAARPTRVRAPRSQQAVAKTPVAEPKAIPVPPPLVAEDKTNKAKKPKMVRDSFTFPKADYAVLQELKDKSNQLASPAKKTELLRAGIKVLASLSNEEFLKAIRAVPSIKTGRPSKNSAE